LWVCRIFLETQQEIVKLTLSKQRFQFHILGTRTDGKLTFLGLNADDFAVHTYSLNTPLSLVGYLWMIL
jgi:hypothetical protein